MRIRGDVRFGVSIEHQGDIYLCDHYVYPEHKLGNITDHSLISLAGSETQSAFGMAKRDALPEYCRSCDIRFACNGEFPKHRFSITSDGEAGLNYLCAAYNRFFHHINPYMDFMARELLQQRPPANVIEYARLRKYSCRST